MREKIVLIDGHSILNRAFYGVSDLTKGDGENIFFSVPFGCYAYDKKGQCNYNKNT